MAKRCPQCKVEKEREGFYKDKHAKDGLHGLCKDCHKAANRARYAANPEKYKASAKARHKANPEKHRAKVKAWADANPEKHKARTKGWREANAEKRKAYDKAWDEANPDRRRARGQRRRARKLSVTLGSFTQEQFEQRMSMFNHMCAYCLVGEHEHTDHYLPLALGGPHALCNLRPACATCNLSKGAKHPLVWLAELAQKKAA